MFNEAFENIIAASAANIKQNYDDYIGEDGLLYCGKCHTAKQVEISLFGTIRRPMCLCECEVKKRDEEEAERKRRAHADMVQKYKNLGFPESDMQNWNFANDDMTNERITKAMRRYVDNFPELSKRGKGLLLHGAVGTGKTYAACEVANALIEKGYPVLVTNFARITNTLQGMYEGKQEYIDSLNRFALLVVDDLGAERGSEYMQEMVYNIIDARYRAGLPMIITTNVNIEQIKKTDDLGKTRIYDRILERCFPVEVAGMSRRRKAVREEFNSMKELLGL